MSHNQPTEFSALLEDLDAGVFNQKVSTALADVALGTVETGKDGKVTITLEIKRIGESNQVQVSHQVKSVRPTKRGRVTEENTTATPLHVGPRGALNLFPESQQRLPLGEPERSA